MPAGLIKASNYYNKIESRKDYLAACQLAGNTPAEGWEELGWRRLDKLTGKLLAGTAYITDGVWSSESLQRAAATGKAT